MPNTKLLSMIAVILLVIGGINYLFIGLLTANLISGILGHILSRLVYLCIGVATGYLIYLKATKQDIHY